VASDIHLEHDGSYDTFDIEKNPDVDYLLLPGDTGSAIRARGDRYAKDSHANGYRGFLIRMTQKFKKVFLVAGNNDFKGTLRQGQHKPLNDGIAAGWAILREWESHPQMNKRLITLNQDRHDFHQDGFNASILGCTLWGNIRNDQPQATRFDKPITGNNFVRNNRRHKLDLIWLKERIEGIRAEDKKNLENSPSQIIVMTHHAPTITRTSDPTRDGIGKDWSNFQVDILGGEGMLGLGKGDVWVFGHTHWSTDFYQDEVRVYSNQRGGFQKARVQVGPPFKPDWFDPSRVLEIETEEPVEWQNWSIPH
jgi:predicted phosphodiesterase